MPENYGHYLYLSGGMNAAFEPAGLQEDQYSVGINVVSRSGAIEPRPDYRRLRLEFEFPSDRHLFEYGRFQGALVYTVGGVEMLVCVISGAIFVVSLTTGFVRQLSSESAYLNQDQPRCYLCQVEGSMIIQDGISRPVIVQGGTARVAEAAPDGPRIGTIMAYGHGRLFTKIGHRAISAGDITQPNDDDAVFKSYEHQDFTIGGAFAVGEDLGEITAMTFANNYDSTSGDGPLLVGTRTGLVTFRVDLSRDDWLTSVFSKVQVRGTGITGSNATAGMNADTLFWSSEGLRSLSVLQAEVYDARRFVNVSRDVQPLYEREQDWFRQFVSLGVSDGRLLTTVGGVVVQAETREGMPVDDVCFQGVFALDFDRVATPVRRTGASPTVAYDGVWTGFNVTKILTRETGAVLMGKRDGVNVICKLGTQTTGMDDYTPIKCRVFTRAFTSKAPPDFEDAPFQVKRFESAVLWAKRVTGEVPVRLWLSTDNNPAFCKVSEMILEAPQEEWDGYGIPEIGATRGIAHASFPAPVFACDPSTGKSLLSGFDFQFCIEWEGMLTFSRLLFRLPQLPEGQNLPCLNDVALLNEAVFPVTPEVKFLRNEYFTMYEGDTRFDDIEFRQNQNIDPGPGSVDPFVWPEGYPALSEDWDGVAIGIAFVAVSYTPLGTDAAMLSTTGESWILGETPSSRFWTDTACGNGVCVGVAATGGVMLSTDGGLTWRNASTVPAGVWYGVTFGGGQFVAVGSGATGVMTSPDGDTWTGQTPAAVQIWLGVAYGDGVYLAISKDGAQRAMTSPDGVTWTLRGLSTSHEWNKVAFGDPDIFVVVARTEGAGQIGKSVDQGVTWDYYSAPTNDQAWNNVVCGDRLFVAISNPQALPGDYSRVMVSSDGEVWEYPVFPTDNLDWHGLAFNEVLGRFVATASTGTGQRAVLSTDGETWVAIDTPADYWWYGVSARPLEASIWNDNNQFWPMPWPYEEPRFAGLPEGTPLPGDVGPQLPASIACGDYAAYVILDNGELQAWGSNSNNRLGFADGGVAVGTGLVNHPEAISSVLDWTQVASGDSFTLAIRDGRLFATGENTYGQLGLGSGAPDQEDGFVQVGVESDWDYICTGLHSSFGIRSGKLYAWGGNSAKELGLGDSLNRYTPVQVGTWTDWEAVAQTGSFALGIRGGKLYSWGTCSHGELGLGSAVDSQSTPQQIGVSTGWTHVAAGYNSSFGIDTGALYSWGYDDDVLGQGAAPGDITAPTQVGVSATWTQVRVSMRPSHYAVAFGINAGELYSWGSVSYYQLGYPSTAGQDTPKQVGVETDWTDIAPSNHAVVGLRNQTVYTWGLNDFSMLGTGLSSETPYFETPVELPFAWLLSASTPSEITYGVPFTLTLTAIDVSGLGRTFSGAGVMLAVYPGSGGVDIDAGIPRTKPTYVGWVANEWSDTIVVEGQVLIDNDIDRITIHAATRSPLQAGVPAICTLVYP